MTSTGARNSSIRRYQGGFGRWLLLLVLLIAGGFALWTWFSLSWAYAEGERAGILQKFVRRGWLCKTEEGEIALYYGGGQYLGAGTSPQLWDFSVRDPAVAAEMTAAVGHRVQLHYTEHPGVPTECFADTRYFVDHVTITDNEPAAHAPAATAPAANGPAMSGPAMSGPAMSGPGMNGPAANGTQAPPASGVAQPPAPPAPSQ